MTEQTYCVDLAHWHVYPVPDFICVPRRSEKNVIADVLRTHHPIMRSETGPLSGCRCGQVGLGQDVIAHVVGHLHERLVAIP